MKPQRIRNDTNLQWDICYQLPGYHRIHQQRLLKQSISFGVYVDILIYKGPSATKTCTRQERMTYQVSDIGFRWEDEARGFLALPDCSADSRTLR
ncbi:hypothetical protein HZH68_005164 [Vespula germanica]|uniref:Uncharacterized protein n=1 Tax=Vespula germanica TaxID=30212 RepID=A0A834ND88_VESGE|nr:hypothetical protein HZH68_005164 [Vespula germanica]